MERWLSGLKHRSWKPAMVNSYPRVQIPISPPLLKKKPLFLQRFFSFYINMPIWKINSLIQSLEHILITLSVLSKNRFYTLNTSDIMSLWSVKFCWLAWANCTLALLDLARWVGGNVMTLTWLNCTYIPTSIIHYNDGLTYSFLGAYRPKLTQINTHIQIAAASQFEVLCRARP